MAKSSKIVKVRLFTGFQEVDDANSATGKNMLEKIYHMGDEVASNELAPHSLQRGEDLGAFYTDEEADDIRAGTYRGTDAEALFRFRNQQAVPAAAESSAATDVSGLSDEEIADIINDQKLTVSQTVDLAGDDLESIEKVLDAENIASNNSPRKGVVDALEAKMAAVAGS